LSTKIRQRLSFVVPALACLFCLGSAFAVSNKMERVGGADGRSVLVETNGSGSDFRYASPATLVLGVLGLAAMLKRPPL